MIKNLDLAKMVMVLKKINFIEYVRRTGSEINEGNFNYILLERAGDVTAEDVEVLKSKLDIASQEKFEGLPDEDKNLFVVLDKLTDKEFSLVYNPRLAMWSGCMI